MERRRLNRELLDNWIKEHGPDGISRLAIESEVSASTIAKVRSGIVVPKKISTRRKLALAIGVEENTLFPLVGAKARAS